jgi:hypothetical protein
MNSHTNITFEANRLVREFYINVEVRGARWAKLRLKLAAPMFKVAAWIAGVGLRLER